MPQVFIDSTATPDQLRLTARFLQDLAALAEGLPVLGAEPEAPAARVVGMVPELGAGFDGPPLDPAVVFAQPAGPVVSMVPSGTSVVIPPPPPPTDVVTAPAANTASTTQTAGTTAAPPSALTMSPDPAAVRLDKDGLPHDTRIHSVTPTMTTAGVWRRRRNLDNATLVAVEAELRATYGANAPKAPDTVTVIPPPPVVSPVVIPPPPAATVIPPPPGGAPPPPVAAGVQPRLDAFRALMARIGPHTMNGGRLAADIMKPYHAQFGAIGWQDYMTKCADRVQELNVVLDGLLA